MIDTRYGDGNVSTSVTGIGLPSGGGSDLSALMRRLVERNMGPPPKRLAFGAKSAKGSRPPLQQKSEAERHNRYVDPLEALKAADAYEMTRRAAATRPTGLGPGMIPGMAVDPRLLPSRMLPGGSSFANVAGASPAGLTPSRPELPDESSNSGFDYMSPVERARWAAAAARTAR
jgi:hypothetical protein